MKKMKFDEEVRSLRMVMMLRSDTYYFGDGIANLVFVAGDKNFDSEVTEIFVGNDDDKWDFIKGGFKHITETWKTLDKKTRFWMIEDRGLSDEERMTFDFLKGALEHSLGTKEAWVMQA